VTCDNGFHFNCGEGNNGHYCGPVAWSMWSLLWACCMEHVVIIVGLLHAACGHYCGPVACSMWSLLWACCMEHVVIIVGLLHGACEWLID